MEAIGFRDRDGYVSKHFRVNGQRTTRRAHRLAWEEHYDRKIPSGMVVMHLCDNPACINVDHLRLGTPGQNWRDCVEKDRHCRGERHPSAKLTEEQAREIRKQYDKGDPRQVIAKRFGISNALVHSIGQRRSWRHLDGTHE